MTKRMKLVPLALYESLMKMREEGQSIQSNSILDASLADDVKISLFQEQKRNENKELQLQRERPVLVKNVNEEKPPIQSQPIDPMQSTPTQSGPTQTEKPVGNPKRDAVIRISEYLKSVGIRQTDQNEIEIGGTPIYETDFDASVRELTNVKHKRRDGTILIMRHLITLPHVPQGVFSRGITKILNDMKAQHVPPVTPKRTNPIPFEFTPGSGRGKGRGKDGNNRFGIDRWFDYK